MTNEKNPYFDPKKKHTFLKYLSIVIGSVLLLEFIAVLTGHSTAPFRIIGFETGKFTYMFFYLISGLYVTWRGFSRKSESQSTVDL
jgi:hypothetical protein